MKRFSAIFLFLLICVAADAKSYICRTDGSVEEFESTQQSQMIKPLRQNEVEEVSLPPQEKLPPKKRSEFVPLTVKDIEARGGS